ncbi:MAG: UDP-N-acetylmuramoyl-tripeptide--D-alanyl-D-alanine ligase [Parcubacteria group bacterium]|jgi:UDP-N-acetylmuramoyl-tripeptide--D-alanyl-D-alanine ligase|nr:UDP-N-acetylmuramoyl-tripeptide--D-alanyl-D-alanine ligase [Candidatus Moranbacteria bacterium]
MEGKPKKIIFLEKMLRFMAVATLKMRKPKVVGITGSVGKTSAKEAIFRVLEGSFKVRKNEENYNNEIGVPLTIIGAKSGEKNIFKWLWVGIRWIFNLIFPFGYPKILILEMAIDRPGDMKYLTSFARPEVGVLTDISASHLEFFDSLNSIAGEKSVLLKSLPENGLAVVNVDNEIIRKIKNKLRSRTVDFGIENEAKIRATDIKFIYDEEEKNIEGLSFKLNQEGNFVPIRLYHIIARHHVYAVLAAVAVGNYFKINLIDMAKSLENLKPPRGRMTPIEGIKGSLVVDDSYNASPVSAIAALNTVEKIRAFRRVAILGDMMELGEESETGHERVAREVLSRNFDALVMVGARMKRAAERIYAEGNLNKKIIFFESPDEAAEKIGEIIKEKDLILVKGSQAMRMEKITEKLMKDPERSKDYLCRQSEKWKKKKFIKT